MLEVSEFQRADWDELYRFFYVKIDAKETTSLRTFETSSLVQLVEIELDEVSLQLYSCNFDKLPKNQKSLVVNELYRKTRPEYHYLLKDLVFRQQNYLKE